MRVPGSFIASARLIAILTLGSRVLGLAREAIFATYFSTSGLLSAFRIAFVVPNLARRLFGEGALSAAMIPVLARSLESRGQESSRRFVGSLLTYLIFVLGSAVLVIELVIAVWRSFSDDVALKLTAILMPYMALICTVAVVGGVLNVRGHFAIPTAVPMILNVGIILAVLGGSYWGHLSGVALIEVVCVGVLVAGVGQLLLSGVALRALSFFPIFTPHRRDPRLRAVVSLMLPMILGLSAVQINSLVDYLIAYLFIQADGQRVGPAVLGYAQYLYQLPLGVFGIAVATAIFPLLSKRAAQDDREGMAAILHRGIRLSLFIALPASVGLLFVAQPLVATIYEHGAFGRSSTLRVAGTLFFYSLGIVAYFMQHLLVRAFHALQDSRTPARVALCMVGINLGLNLVLVFVLAERGLALATAVCATIQVVWLSFALRHRMPEIPWKGIARGAVKPLLATGAMVVMLGIVAERPLAYAILGQGSAIRLTALVLTGVITYGLAARLLRIEELTLLLGRDRSLTDSVDGA